MLFPVYRFQAAYGDFLFPIVNSKIKILKNFLRLFSTQRKLIGIIQAHTEIITVSARLHEDSLKTSTDSFDAFLKYFSVLYSPAMQTVP